MEQDEFDDLPSFEGTQKKKGRRGCLVALIVLLSLLLLVLLAIAMLGNYFLERLGRFENPVPVDGSIPKMSDEFDTETQVGIESMETVDASDVTFETVDVLEGNMVNIMLIGQDRRPGEERARSDSMILVTLNKEKNTIQLTSFMRDLYVQIPGYMDNRLNVAYRYGGTSLMNDAFRVNFGLEIDGNVMVDFDEFTEIIEVIGGVTLDMSSAEANYMNKHSDNSFKSGSNYLNAEDALTFTRMRYAAGGDYGRTDRQRRVLMALAESVRDTDVWTLLELFDRILPHIVTNLDNAEVLQCIKDGASILSKGGEIQTYRIPQDDAHYQASIRGMAVLVPDLEMCREDLREFIYSSED